MVEKRLNIEVCILAGGLSSRMGRDKARLKLQGRTLVGWALKAGLETGWKVRVVRRDLVKRCGPLGGVYTALKTTRADAVIFLACDMPLVSGAFLLRLARRLTAKGNAVFMKQEGVMGFPFLLRQNVLAVVESQLTQEQFSLQTLARACGAVGVVPAKAERWRFLNVNTPEDWAAAKAAVKQSERPFGATEKSH